MGHYAIAILLASVSFDLLAGFDSDLLGHLFCEMG
jgi:hypothetical protein